MGTNIVDKSKQLCDITYITMKETKMRNVYIDQGIIDDCHNDHNVILTLRTKIHDAIQETEKSVSYTHLTLPTILRV